MNDNPGYPGDETFDDGVGQAYDGYYGGQPISNSKNQGLVVGFPPGSVLVQLASSSPTGGRAYQKLLVHAATTDLPTAQADASINNPDPAQRLIYVGGQAIPSGGGAIELNVPSGSWLMYGYQWPEASRANVSTNAIIFRQGGSEVPHITVYRQDGVNGDPDYDPLFPFKMRGSVDPYGNVIGGVNVSNLTYAIDVPVVTNAPFDIIACSDASSVNTLVKLDGGMDLNSQMGLGPTNFRAGIAPTNFLDLRDNPPGYADDVFLGYEQTAFQFRNGPEKFAARNVLSNNIVSLGAETYYYTVGGGSNVVDGSGYGHWITNQTASWVHHDPGAANTALSPDNTATQRTPLSPSDAQPADIYVKAGYQFEINTCFIYYTTDGSNPEGAFGTGRGTTQLVQAHFLNHDSVESNVDWWKGTIPAQPTNTTVRYKVALFYGGSSGNSSVPTISDAEPQGSKLYGLTQNVITNFNPATATVWMHNDLNPANTVTGLQPGFHIVRMRTFLPRTNQSSVYNTFLQTFYYDGALPTGLIVYPAGGSTISSSSYTVVVRTDGTVTGVDFNVQDGSANNDDLVTGLPDGNGNDTNGAPMFVPAAPVSPDPTLSLILTNFPQEFRFVYANVPTNGTATIQVRLKEYATTLYTNRITLLTATANTHAPQQTVQISSPVADGAIVAMTSHTTYLVQTCFTPALDTNDPGLFSLSINGVMQPSSSFFFGPAGAAGCPGMGSLFYNWTAASPGTVTGTNFLQIVYYNSNTGVYLSDTRTVIVPPPLVISGLANNQQQILWDSAPGVNYQVLATTNLTQPFQPIGGITPSQGATTSFYDPDPAPQKFYEIEMVQ